MLGLDEALTHPVTRFGFVPGARLEAIGDLWAAYSPASGQTHILNDESAVILEWLQEHGDADTTEVAEGLSTELAVDVEHLRKSIDLAWMPLLVAGLVRQLTVQGQPAGHCG